MYYSPTSQKGTTVGTLTRRAQFACDTHNSLTDKTKHLTTLLLLRTNTAQTSLDAILMSGWRTALTAYTGQQPLYCTYERPRILRPLCTASELHTIANPCSLKVHLLTKFGLVTSPKMTVPFLHSLISVYSH